MEDSFTYLNKLYEEAKLKVLNDLRTELKTIIENQFKESCHETSRHKQKNDFIVLLKEELEYLKEKLKGKIMQF